MSQSTGRLPSAHPPDWLHQICSMRKLLAGDLTVTHSSRFVTMTSWTPTRADETQEISQRIARAELTVIVATNVNTIATTNVGSSDGEVVKLSVRTSVDCHMKLRRVDEDQVMKRKVRGIGDAKEPGTREYRYFVSVTLYRQSDVMKTTYPALRHS